ncbi:SIMPL domain-containing protein [Parahaliea aestuarii]|uniref:SIMPL domain-containing protein n=1 Tax=Parahaliea aestuarii TaxID=1852021 RepID=A0A5C9A198_9GAMM|nr:SIMPL domain-containing protein [Parahaliea aestuarii]TXS93550.1 SIMPL domain-containing protein [Parahaliea aestuarii]
MSLRVVLAGWLLCCAAAVSLPALADESDTGRIHVTGEGSAALAPDMATLSLTVTREGDTASEALAANTEAMRQVMAAMRKAGVADKDLQTSQFNISPRYSRVDPRSGDDDQGPRIVGYQVRNGLTVRVRDINLVGKLLDSAVQQGVNEGGQITLGNADPAAAIDRARQQAMRDALSRARVLAEAAGVKTGRILEIQEQSFHGGPSPAPMYRMSEMAMADSVPVAGGENEYRVNVSLTIAIQP